MIRQNYSKRSTSTSSRAWKVVSLFSFIVLLTSFQGFAQMNLNDPDTGAATIGSAGCISLVDDNGNVHNLYQLEYVEQHFQDIDLLKKRLGSISNNRVAFGLNVSETAIMMFIHKDRTAPANSNSILWWNNYISNSCIQL
ncbi:MAG: hypothetical protein ACI865_003200 [Flavobacteriaceae bacterium]|jgi:hypothetical protein